MKNYYAHSLPGRPPEKWQSMEQHLKNVAELARGFAEPFGAGETEPVISRFAQSFEKGEVK